MNIEAYVLKCQYLCFDAHGCISVSIPVRLPDEYDSRLNRYTYKDREQDTASANLEISLLAPCTICDVDCGIPCNSEWVCARRLDDGAKRIIEFNEMQDKLNRI